MKRIILGLLLVLPFLYTSAQKTTIKTEDGFVIMKNPYSKIKIADVIDSMPSKGIITIDIPNKILEITFENNEKDRYYLTTELSSSNSDDNSSFEFSALFTSAKDNYKTPIAGNLKFTLYNNKYTGGKRSVFIFDNDYLSIVLRGKNATYTP